MKNSGHLFWRALYKDGTVVTQLTQDGERSALDIDHKQLHKFTLETFDGMVMHATILSAGHRLIFRRRVTLSYEAGPGGEAGEVRGKRVHYIVGLQHSATGLLWIEVLDDHGLTVKYSDQFIETDPLLRSPVFLPQEGIVKPRHGYVLYYSGTGSPAD